MLRDANRALVNLRSHSLSNGCLARLNDRVSREIMIAGTVHDEVKQSTYRYADDEAVKFNLLYFDVLVAIELWHNRPAAFISS